MPALHDQAIGMTAEDLAANERGELSAGQRRRLRSLCRRWLGIAALGALLAAGGAASLGLAGARGLLGPGWAAAGSAAAAAGLLAAGVGWRKRSRLLAALALGAAAAVEGAASYRIAHGFGLIRVTTYAVQVAGRRFPVPQATMFAFASQGAYRIFFAPGTDVLLGAVPLAAAPPVTADHPPGGAILPVQQPAAAEHPPAEPLTARERAILGLIAEGRSNQEIADQLYLALPTVKMHASQLYAKLGVRRRTEAAAAARRWDLLAAPPDERASPPR